MRSAFSAILGITLVACSSAHPIPIRAGDVCLRCNRVITEPRLGAQLLASNGTASVFRTPGCLAKYLQDHTPDGRSIYVTDYDTGEFIPVANAMFVRARIDEATGERDFYAFRSAAKAAKFAEDKYSGVVDWSMVRTLAASTSKGD